MTNDQRQIRSRRRFVAAMAVAGVGYWSERVVSASTSPNELLDIAAIGVGNRGAVNLAAVKSERIVALCDVDERFLDRQQATHPQARRYRDFRKLLDVERRLDAVVVSTPDHTHFHPTLEALQRKLHVYCEKPLAHSVAEVRALREAARRAGTATQTGNQHHNSAGYRRAVQWLRSGELGPVREVHSWTNRPLWPQGMVGAAGSEPVPEPLVWNLWLGPAPQRPHHSSYYPFKWRGWWDFGGGALADMGPHLIDPIYRGLNLGMPAKIEVVDSAPVSEQSPPKWSVLRFHFPQRGALPPLTLTWYDGGRQPPAEVTRVKQPPSNGSLVLGYRGRLFIPELGKRPIAIAADSSRPLEPPASDPNKSDPDSPSRPSPGHYAEWIGACKGGPPAGSPFETGAQLTQLCLLGNVALCAGQTVHFNDTAGTIRPHAAERFLQRSYRSW